MTRWTKLQRITGSPRGLTVLTGSALLFLLLAYFLNGQPALLTIFKTATLTYTIPHYGTLLIVSILFGTTITIFQHNFSLSTAKQRSGMGVASFLGLLMSGCAGCVAGILPGLLAFLGISGSLVSLPLLGTEILIATVLIYVVLIYYLLSPSQCPMPAEN